MVDAIFESPGAWWLPARSARRIPGLMRVGAKGELRIHLFETLDEESNDFGTPTRHPVIHGSLHESPLGGGTDVTHFDSFAVRRSLRSNGTTAETLVANRSYVGDEHLGNGLHAFANYSAELSGLSAWMPFSVVDRSAPDGNVRVEVKKPMRLSGRVAGTRMDFVRAAEVSFSDLETVIRERAHVEFVLDARQPPDAFEREVVVPLRFLMSLALGERAKIETLDIVIRDEPPWPVEVHDLEVWAHAKRTASAVPVRSFDTLIAPPRDDSELQQLLTAWWDVHGRLRPAIERIFALWDSPPTFIEVRFGALFEAFELLAQSLPSSPQSMIEELGDPIVSLLPPLAKLTEQCNGVSQRLRSGQRTDPQELLRLSELLPWLMRFVLVRQLGVDLDRASRVRAFRFAASRFEAS